MAGVAAAGNKSKLILRQFPIIRFYGALALSTVFFLIQLIVAHAAHSLILQIDTYHMLYNILSLVTCIVTAKASKQGNSLKNTFGWRRIDVCGAVANLCFLSALGFSVVVECLQAILHASHHEKMHYPLIVGVIGVLGLLVNFAIFFLIGGYTLHQSGFLCSTKDGRGDDSVIPASMRRGPYNHVMRERQGAFEMFRDIFGCVLVVLCAIIVYYWTDDDNADYVDPCLTIITVFVLGVTSYKYATEAGHILLLTIPNHINVAVLQSELKRHFPEVFDIHEFHVWQLTPARIIASVHVVLQKPHGYLSIQDSIIGFLHDKGISHVTMQPEFLQMTDGEIESPDTIRKRNKCFLPCHAEDECHDRQCCLDDEDEHDHDHEDHHHHGHSHGGDFGHFENVSINNSSFSNVQNPSLLSGESGRVGYILKSESLNNHLDISMDLSRDSVSINNGNNGAANNPNNLRLNQVGEVSDESSDDDEEQVEAELRPMI